MKITFICVGAIKKAYIKDGVEEYLKRIKRYSPAEVVEVKEESSSVKMPREGILKKEGERIIKRLKAREDYVVVLGERGKSLNSAGFSDFLSVIMSGGKKGVAFVVGGAYGLHDTVTEMAHTVLSLSEMTLSHELARLVLSEQVYRAFTIIKGEPYAH